MTTETVWTFNTANFRITLELSPSNECYDGDDEDGEVQRKLNDGTYYMFDSTVTVYDRKTGVELGSDSLGMSVYEDTREFWTAHWSSSAEHRNCAANSYCVGHYFPGMVKEACEAARKTLTELNSHKMRIVA